MFVGYNFRIMLTRLAITALGITLFFAYGPNKSGAQQKQPPQPIPAAPVTIVDNSTRQAAAYGTSEKPPEPHAGVEWSNWALVLIGGLGVLAAYGTLRKIERQTKATEVAAKGAMESGAAFIEAERAWIMAETGNISDDFEPDPTRLEIFEIRPVIANRGRTTGRIVRGCIAQVQPKSARELPPEPDYSGEMGNAQVDFVLAPGGAAQPLQVKLSAWDFLPLRRGERKLYIYGFVRYLVMGEHERETRFCFEYYVPGGFTSQPRGFYQAIDVPPAYTRCT
jgi:hypothetical protein